MMFRRDRSEPLLRFEIPGFRLRPDKRHGSLDIDEDVTIRILLSTCTLLESIVAVTKILNNHVRASVRSEKSAPSIKSPWVRMRFGEERLPASSAWGASE